MQITAYIVSLKDNEAVPNIAVIALDSAGNPIYTNATTTNLNGEFTINIEPTQEVLIKGLGFKDKIVSPKEGDIILVETQSYGIPEVVIEETRSVVEAPKKNWWKVVIAVVVLGVVVWLIVRYYKK